VIKNCSLSFKCTQKWETLSKTDKVNVKFCELCSNKVFFVTTDEELNKYAELNKCIAFMDQSNINLWSTPFVQEPKNISQKFTETKLKKILPYLGIKNSSSIAITNLSKIKKILNIGILRGYLLYSDIEPLLVEIKLEGQNLYDLVEALNKIGILFFENSPTSTGFPSITYTP
jgi:hypothetical protein